MRGQVLGFDGTKGAISGDDGQRYPFVQASWKGDRLPRAQDTVDFVVVAGDATDIYPLHSSFGAVRERLGKGGARTLLAERPQVVISGVVIIASFLLGFASNTGMSGGSVSLVRFPSMVGMFRSHMSQLGNIIDSEVNTGVLLTASALAYLLWLIPAGAAFLIFRNMTGRRMRGLELAVGALCVASIVIYRFCTAALDAHPAVGFLREFAVLSFSFGLGGYLIVLCGIGLILTGLGRLTRTPGI